MSNLLELLARPWPWWVAGPLIGLMVPTLLLLGNRAFGVSSTLRHACAAVAPCSLPHLTYDWKKEGGWNLAFVAGIGLGAFLATTFIPNPDPVALSPATRAALHELGLRDLSGLVPREAFSWSALFTLRGIVLVVVGGFLVGFGSSWAGGCTSGHAITGLADRQLPSLLAVIGFFAGGLFATHLLLPLLFR